MNENIQTKPISFARIFREDFDGKRIGRIEIPIIQRDYAQGRTTDRTTRIRERFLAVLHEALTGGDPVKLDFVYGDITPADNGKFKMIPLDGQQRLTTLFLLHWYVSRHEEVEQSDFLRSFTYRTRFSSKDFCAFLTGDYRPDFGLKTISEHIRDEYAFREAWNNDPTVISMLEMLDAIHARFRETAGLWEKLVAEEHPAISFYFLPIQDMGLTDSLYIKMNSRGKPLTDFEHFKAAFEKIIKEVSPGLHRRFSDDVDNKWTHMLWPYRGENNITDDEFLRYYRFVTEMICYRHGYAIRTNDIDLAETVYGRGNDRAAENLEFLFAALDCWCGIDIDGFFDGLFALNQHIPGRVKVYNEFGGTNLFKHCCDYYEPRPDQQRTRYFSYYKSLLLYAVLTYALNRDDEEVSRNVAERLRIVRNLIWHSGDEIREERMQVLLHETRQIMLEGRIDPGSGGYNRVQKNEETEKIAWRAQSPAEARLELDHLEDHYLLQGTAGIVDFQDLSGFVRRSETFRTVFTHEVSYQTISRALLTCGDYSRGQGWRRWFGGRPDSSWRDMFRPGGQRGDFDKTRECLLSLLDKIDSGQPVLPQLEGLIDRFTADAPRTWLYYFVKYESMRSGSSGVYWWRDPYGAPYEVIMMNTPSSLNGWHWNPFLFQLAHDPELSAGLELGHYGSPLTLLDSGTQITCKNDHWLVKHPDGTEESCLISQNADGIDTEDRIEAMKNRILNKAI